MKNVAKGAGTFKATSSQREGAAFRARFRLKARTVSSLIDELVEVKRTEKGEGAGEYIRLTSRLFRLALGDFNLAEIASEDLIAYREALVDKGYEPKTINHYLSSARAILRYGIEIGAIKNVSLRGLQSVAMPYKEPKSESLETVASFIAQARSHRNETEAQNLENMLTVAFMGSLRPTELLRLSNREGEWISDNVFKPKLAKTNKAGGFPRHLVFPDSALPLIEKINPKWAANSKGLSAFGQFCTKYCGRTCHFLRHSSAQNFVDLGAPPHIVSTILGHYSHAFGRNTFRYIRPSYFAECLSWLDKSSDLLVEAISQQPTPEKVREGYTQQEASVDRWTTRRNNRSARMERLRKRIA